MGFRFADMNRNRIEQINSNVLHVFLKACRGYFRVALPCRVTRRRTRISHSDYSCCSVSCRHARIRVSNVFSKICDHCAAGASESCGADGGEEFSDDDDDGGGGLELGNATAMAAAAAVSVADSGNLPDCFGLDRLEAELKQLPWRLTILREVYHQWTRLLPSWRCALPHCCTALVVALLCCCCSADCCLLDAWTTRHAAGCVKFVTSPFSIDFM